MVSLASLLETTLSQNFHQLMLNALPMSDELDTFLDSFFLNIKRCKCSEKRNNGRHVGKLYRLPVSVLDAGFSTGSSLSCGYAGGRERKQDVGVSCHWICFGDCYHDKNVMLLLIKISLIHFKFYRFIVE